MDLRTLTLEAYNTLTLGELSILPKYVFYKTLTVGQYDVLSESDLEALLLEEYISINIFISGPLSGAFKQALLPEEIEHYAAVPSLLSRSRGIATILKSYG